MENFFEKNNCVKNVRIRSFSGPYSVRMRKNTEQKNSEFGHFSLRELSQQNERN